MPTPELEANVPKLAGHVRLGVDPLTQFSVLLYPEGILELDEAAAAILRLCDGQLSIGEIASALADEYEASREEILKDAQEFLAGLATKGLLRWETDHR
ncbi:MAG TPA: pyrroloquinoline quinone biosynthesis peptide chaperone PqqD [Candidatus Methylacidiphilales bacterium]